MLTNGKMYNVSKQQLIECSTGYGNHGCIKGTAVNGFRYLTSGANSSDSKQLQYWKSAWTEEEYPYTGKYSGEEACKATEDRYDRHLPHVNVTKYWQVPRWDEAALRQAVATIGPVAVTVDASVREFQFYSSGIFALPSCRRYHVSHGMLLVGYDMAEESATNPDKGSAKTTPSYWILKNSLGDGWGEEGFMKLVAGRNQCGISSLASFAVVRAVKNK